MKTYRVAILGCRGRGTAAARAYHAHPRTEIVALCDLVQDLLDTLGDELGVAARYTDLDEMIGQHQPDIVAIPTGTEFHHSLALRVLEYGTHIDIEKPLCVDCQQADEVLAKAREKNARIAVHHQGRVGVYMKAVARALAEGRIGQLRHIHGHGKTYYGGYNLMNIGTHMINNMLKVAGPCHSVVATATTDGHPITPTDVVPSPQGMGTIAGEHITATLSFADGVTATLLQHRFPHLSQSGDRILRHRRPLSTLAARLEKGPRRVPAASAPLRPQRPKRTVGSAAAHLLRGLRSAEFGPPRRLRLCRGSTSRHSTRAANTNVAAQAGHHIVEIMMGIFESAAYGKTGRFTSAGPRPSPPALAERKRPAPTRTHAASIRRLAGGRGRAVGAEWVIQRLKGGHNRHE